MRHCAHHLNQRMNAIVEISLCAGSYPLHNETPPKPRSDLIAFPVPRGTGLQKPLFLQKNSQSPNRIQCQCGLAWWATKTLTNFRRKLTP